MCTHGAGPCIGDWWRDHSATMGLLGHSDADVLLHAINHDAPFWARRAWAISAPIFPDNDAQFRGADSAVLLRGPPVACALPDTPLQRGQHRGGPAPRLAAHIPGMRECIARASGVRAWPGQRQGKDCRAPGAVGSGLAMEARAAALIYKA